MANPADGNSTTKTKRDLGIMEYREDTPDCTLELELGHFVVENNQPARPRDATPDWPFPHHTYQFMLGRKWGDDSVCSTDPADMKPAETLKAATIGRKTPETQWGDKLVQVYATIMLDRESDAREFHKIYLTGEQWDMIASSVHIDEKVILEGCTIRFDPKDEPIVVNTEENYDYGEGEGFSTGTFKRYIPGVIDDVTSIWIARELHANEPSCNSDNNHETSEQQSKPWLYDFNDLLRIFYDSEFPLSDRLQYGEDEYD